MDRVAQDLPSLTRAWMAHTRFVEASAKLRTVAPGPVAKLDLAALRALLGVDCDALDRADVLRAIGLAAERLPDAHVRSAMMSSVDAALDAMYP